MTRQVALTPKRRAFCRFYIQHEDAKKAALEADYSPGYAHRRAYKLLQVPEVAAEIKRLRTRANEQADKSAVDVINEFSKIAFEDRVSFLKEDPHSPGEFIYKAPDELTEDQRAIVEKVTYNLHEITVIEDGEVQKLWVKHYSYVLADKSKALEQMGRHFGIFDDKLRIGVSTNNPLQNATPEQLEKLKASWVATMGHPQIVDGEFKVLEHDKT